MRDACGFRYGVKAPTMYAVAADTKEKSKEDAMKYNCVQRVHQNT